jgi:peptidoglycan/LPS O-acetylase OafA/YrhL
MNIKKLNFQRITSTGNFIPEIDGLRFIAISTVIVYHLSAFWDAFNTYNYPENPIYSFLFYIFRQGSIGVPLFFVISGFILGLPFAKYHINNEKKVSIKNYFLRRLTRLEPPYLLVMSVMFFAYVYVVQKYPFDLGLSSYFSSIFYSHNYIFEKMPLLNSVAWSLEVEVQFYILAPILAYLFIIKSQFLRRSVIIILIVLTSLIDIYFSFDFKSLINSIEYFLIGFLLTDLYISKTKLLTKTSFDNLICLVFFGILFYSTKNISISTYELIFIDLIKLASIFFLYNYILFNGALKFLSWKIITNIGGMCYSIYLLHFPLISLFGKPLLKFSISENSFVNISIYSILVIFVVLFISSIFFILIERPCMDKNWYKNIFNKKNRRSLLS